MDINLYLIGYKLKIIFATTIHKSLKSENYLLHYHTNNRDKYLSILIPHPVVDCSHKHTT